MEMIDTRIYDDAFLLAKIFEHTELNKDEKERLYKHFEKRKKGQWIRIYANRPKQYTRICSECRETSWFCGIGDYNYCPWCGAEMVNSNE